MFSFLANIGTAKSLPEIYRTIRLDPKKSIWARFFTFVGPGYLVAVGYIDPGNWSTDLGAGSQYGYTLLFVVLFSSLIAMLVQSLAVRLAVGREKDLAQCSAENTGYWLRITLWLCAELAIIATDLAEVLGSAIALKLLFGVPLLIGVCITVFDVLLLLLLLRFNFRYVESLIISFIIIIALCIGTELFLSPPDFAQVWPGFLPTSELWTNRDLLYLSIGILGATVMPHNLYLHSAIVQSRNWGKDERKAALRYASIDSFVALTLTFFLNAGILMLAASAFHMLGKPVNDIQEAYELLSPLLGAPIASLLFGLALLLCGQTSTITGTLTGQVVMEGFINIRLKPWLRRLITRLLATIPVIFTLLVWGEKEVTALIVLSQVVLSLQLPLAVIPLVWFTSDKGKMGEFANPFWLKTLGWAAAVLICVLNGVLIYQFM